MRFAELIGQELASGVLRRAIREDRIAHAYLFAGPEGTGKLTAALAFAAALNCESLDSSGDGCGNCTSCRMAASGNHADVEIISPDGAETKIKQMREMRRTAFYAPLRGKWKVAIIEQADTLNEESSSAILKILEEPPAYLVIIVLSRNPALLLATIRSRCLLIRFSQVRVEDMARALVERFGATEEDARFLAAYSEGRPGCAIRLLGNDSFFEWRRQLTELAAAISTEDRRRALRLSEELQRLAGVRKEDGQTQRAAMRSALQVLSLWYRDLLNLSVRGQAAELINTDLRERLVSIRSDAGAASAAIETLLWACRVIEGNANVQLTSDVTVMRLMA